MGYGFGWTEWTVTPSGKSRAIPRHVTLTEEEFRWMKSLPTTEERIRFVEALGKVVKTPAQVREEEVKVAEFEVQRAEQIRKEMITPAPTEPAEPIKPGIIVSPAVYEVIQTEEYKKIREEEARRAKFEAQRARQIREEIITPKKPTPIEIYRTTLAPHEKAIIERDIEIMEARGKMIFKKGTMEPDFFKIREKAAEMTWAEKEGTIALASYGAGFGITAVTPLLPTIGQFGVQAVGAATTGLYAGELIREKRVPTKEELIGIQFGLLGAMAGMEVGRPVTKGIEIGEIARKKEMIAVKSKIITKAGLKKYGTEVKSLVKPLPPKGEVQRAIGISEFVMKETPKAKGRVGIAASKVISTTKGQYTAFKGLTKAKIGRKEVFAATKGLSVTKKAITGSIAETLTAKGEKGVIVSFLKEAKPPTKLPYTYISPKPTKTKPFTFMMEGIAKTVEATIPKTKPFIPTVPIKPTKVTPVKKAVAPPKEIFRPVTKQRVVTYPITGYPYRKKEYPLELTISKEWARVEQYYPVPKVTPLKTKLAEREKVKKKPEEALVQIPRVKQIVTPVLKPIQVPVQKPIGISAQLQPQKQLQRQRQITRQITPTITPPMIPIVLPPFIPFGLGFPRLRVEGIRRIGIPKRFKRRLKYTPSLAGIYFRKPITKIPKRITGMEIRPPIKRKKKKKRKRLLI